ncbi:MAG: hypothetical protein HC834_06600 [Rhodospirillales bacterium]|nr:hypothetical protein [Rhodospirillales bacterium]
MESSITQTFAAILIVLSLLKVCVMIINPRIWLDFAKRLYTRPPITSFVALLIAAGILLGLLRSGLDIVQILAVCLFVACLVVVGMAPYAPRLLVWFETQDMAQIIRSQGIYITAWVVLLGWGAYTLLT